ncbi:molybdopterin-dependent oxidoreductase [Acidianus sulfidivorans JP7]|uniref:Aldehyde oxidase n=1 Tax=Acidianus sulfidivorans JP7 TaxID=619593 RepID=A0A2U9IPS0_9CREN|nr:glyceraldehyde dehydrogenase subunit alpha [Acidianus sulfidivorans]AWR98011.1 molybdopterin-dependent oxidoreductase [Acidianus sulfidivorans JP7]
MYVGQRIKRKEDLKLITGNGRYVDDINIPGQLYLSILRSRTPHAKLKKVDYSDALKLQGVVGVITGLNLNVENRPRNFPMAKDEILYVGHPIAAVLATDRYVAADALDYITYDYEELPAVIDPEEAMKNENKAVEDKNNIIYNKTYKGGNPEEAYEKSEVKIEEKLDISRVYPAAMEPRGLVIDYSPDRLTIYASTQSPHYMKAYLTPIFNTEIRVIQADVGGAFGSKLFPYAEEFISVYASLQYKRPIKFINTRSEDLMSTYHGRGQIHKVKLGATKGGKVNAIIDDLIIDLGAAWHGTYLADIPATLITGPYDIKNALVNVYGVLTNKTPLDQYRGAGRPEAAFVYERMMDILADELKMDPIEIRKLNVIQSTPYVNPFGLKYDTGDYKTLLYKAEETYKEFETQAEELRKQGKRAGVGLTFYIEQNNFGPWESASVRVLFNGKIEVIIGAAPHGQGTATGIAQIVADELGVNIDDVEVTWGDTDKISNGFGTYGSRSLTLAGNAALLASRKLKENLIKLASSFMQADPEELMYKDGKVINPKTGASMSIKEIAMKATSNLGGIWGYKAEPTLEATSSFGLDNYTFPYGAHIALVEVTEEGKIKVHNYVVIDDIGKVINPMLAEGQVEGGTIQAFGEATLEQIIYDKQGNLLTSSFSDYLIPSSLESFNLKWNYIEKGLSEAPVPAKGIGEGATIGGLNAIVRAVEKATGKRITKIPISSDLLI